MPLQGSIETSAGAGHRPGTRRRSIVKMCLTVDRRGGSIACEGAKAAPREGHMLETREVERYERELRAMLRRAGDEDPEGFAMIAQLLVQASNGLRLAAELNRAQHGYSWAELAAALGTTRQAAQQRYGRPKGSTGSDPRDADTIKAAIRRQVGVYVRPDVIAAHDAESHVPGTNPIDTVEATGGVL